MAFCSKCGRQMDDFAQFCPGCGASRAQTNANPNPNININVNPGFVGGGAKVSKWDGTVIDTVIHSIVASLIISITCGIALPWALCYLWGFIVDHVIIDGRRLKFSGTGGSLFGNWIIWFLLTMVTCGIYSFWVAPKLYNWVASNTHFE